MTRRFTWAAFLLLAGAAPCSAVTMDMFVDGDSTFFAVPGDTVTVEVFVDSEGEELTGVELYLAFDAQLFSVLDAGAGAGIQPAASDSLLGSILADSLLTVSDSLVLVHFAEADLGGRSVNGRLFALRAVVEGWRSGAIDIGVYANETESRRSAFTLADADGAREPWVGVRPLRFRDFPPVLTPPASLVTPEDMALSVRLDTLASDEAPAFLDWAVAPASGDSLVAVSLRTEGDSVVAVVIPAADIFGTEALMISVSDPGGGRTSVEVPLQILPVNDPPVIEGDSLTVVLSDSAVQAVVPYPDVVDIDDEMQTLVWSTVSTGVVEAAVDPDALRLSVPAGWFGEDGIDLLAVDPKGLSDTLAIVVRRDPAPEFRPGDFDSDGDVDFEDFLLFAAAFGKPDADSAFDLTGDGSVDFSDFLEFAAVFGK